MADLGKKLQSGISTVYTYSAPLNFARSNCMASYNDLSLTKMGGALYIDCSCEESEVWVVFVHTLNVAFASVHSHSRAILVCMYCINISFQLHSVFHHVEMSIF